MFNVENVNQREFYPLGTPPTTKLELGDNTLEIAVSVNDGGADSSTILITVDFTSD